MKASPGEGHDGHPVALELVEQRGQLELGPLQPAGQHVAGEHRLARVQRHHHVDAARFVSSRAAPALGLGQRQREEEQRQRRDSRACTAGRRTATPGASLSPSRSPSSRRTRARRRSADERRQRAHQRQREQPEQEPAGRAEPHRVAEHGEAPGASARSREHPQQRGAEEQLQRGAERTPRAGRAWNSSLVVGARAALEELAACSSESSTCLQARPGATRDRWRGSTRRRSSSRCPGAARG